MKSCKFIKEQPNMFQGFTIVKPLSFWPFWALENSKPTSIYLVARTWILYILLNLQSRAVLGVGKSGGFLALLSAVSSPQAEGWCKHWSSPRRHLLVAHASPAWRPNPGHSWMIQGFKSRAEYKGLAPQACVPPHHCRHQASFACADPTVYEAALWFNKKRNWSGLNITHFIMFGLFWLGLLF